MHNESIEQTQPLSLSRRKFLRAGTGAALGLGLGLPSLGWLTGCTSLPAARAPAWNELAASLQGPLLMPGAPDFAAKARPWALQYASTLPQGIAQCLGEADVRACRHFSR